MVTMLFLYQRVYVDCEVDTKHKSAVAVSIKVKLYLLLVLCDHQY